MIDSRFAIELLPHDAAWALTAKHEAERLRGALGDILACVHHAGSTAIPGIRAKPIVDLVPLVTSLALLDEHCSAVESLGYAWHGELGIIGRRYCILSGADGKRVAQLHIFASDHPEPARMLAFRDHLRAHPEEARAYEEEKLRARARHPDDVNAYNAAKEAWIRACIERALAPPRS